MDSDGFALRNLDHLFYLEMINDVQIAAPQGYWFRDYGLLPQHSRCPTSQQGFDPLSNSSLDSVQGKMSLTLTPGVHSNIRHD